MNGHPQFSYCRENVGSLLGYPLFGKTDSTLMQHCTEESLLTSSGWVRGSS